MAKAKSTPIPLVEEGCCNSDVFVVQHIEHDGSFDGGSDGEVVTTEFGGVYSNEKAANKAAKAWKSELGVRGKEAKKHLFIVECCVVSDKFEG